MSNGGILRRPAVPPPVRIRRDVNILLKENPNHPIIAFYEKAIGVMKQRSSNNNPATWLPTSWRYQGAIHDFPEPAPGAHLPGDGDTFWRQCQHGSWFFLSWHRMYLHHFEKIIMNIVAKTLDGPSDWALPYWNYSTSADTAKLPKPFQGVRIPDPKAPGGARIQGQTILDPLAPGGKRISNLFVEQRTPAANLGNSFLDVFPNGAPDPSNTKLDCLKATPFGGVDSTPPPRTFGGIIRFSHPIDTPGALESVPHNVVHNHFGAGSLMLNPETAALDPIFWLHHCNIDRLWEVWVQRQKHLGTLIRNPKKTKSAGAADFDPELDVTDPSFDVWLDGPFPPDPPFKFHDGVDPTGKAEVTNFSRDFLNTRLAPLSYEYDDTSDPFNGAAN